jgi:hypothetical protein
VMDIQPRSLWVGWVYFGGAMMVMPGDDRRPAAVRRHRLVIWALIVHGDEASD